LEQSVATPIEQQMNGVDNRNYMYSLNATANSSTSLIVDFDPKPIPTPITSLPKAVKRWLLLSFPRTSSITESPCGSPLLLPSR